MTQLYFQDDPYLEADPGQNASTRLAMHTIRHDDPQELTTHGMEGRHATGARILPITVDRLR